MSELTQEELKRALHYDPDTGVFTWLRSRSTKMKPGAVAGYIRPDGYRMVRVEGGKYLSHRLAWLYSFGVWPAKFIDHINGDPSDNRLSNLREADHSTNGMNRPRQANSTWGRGVHKSQSADRWIAEIKTNGVKKYLGSFPSPEEARAAYLSEAAATRGEFVRID